MKSKRADYVGGKPDHEKPCYFVEIRIPIRRLDVLAKAGLIRDFTRVILDAEGSAEASADARRVWVTIHEIEPADWGIGGHTDWLRDYTSALDEVGGGFVPS
jgi:phenylpyruvate tautomerase PptA (4-oxalocrotonate tautomerase family)